MVKMFRVFNFHTSKVQTKICFSQTALLCFIIMVYSPIAFEKIYQRLGVTVTERGESFYQSMMPETVKDLESKGIIVRCTCILINSESIIGLLKEDQGSKVIFVPGHELPLMIVKSDGAFTYDTSDMTALRHRVSVEKGDWLIYVVDSGQVGLLTCM